MSFFASNTLHSFDFFFLSTLELIGLTYLSGLALNGKMKCMHAIHSKLNFKSTKFII